MQQLVKLLKAIDFLSQTGGITKKELAEKLEVSERQVYRIINRIRDLRFPLDDEKIPMEKEKRWKFDEDFIKKLPNINIPDISLSIPEIISLYLLKGEEKLYQGTEIEKTINSAFNKIGRFLPDETTEQLKKIKTLFVPAAKFKKDYSGKEDIIDKLTDAMLERKSCLAEYHSFHADEVKSLRINPLHFFERNGGLYFFACAHSDEYERIITLAVERIEELAVTEDSFEYPEDFDPEALLESAFDIIFENPVDFKIWFSAAQARYIKERVWSKTQKIEDQEDGSIIFTMRTAGMQDVKRWVLGYGVQAEVLEPKELRKDIAKELKKTHDKYIKK